MPCKPFPKRSHSGKSTPTGNIFRIPPHPGHPEEYNINEPAPLNIRKVLQAQNTKGPPLAPAAVLLQTKSPVKTALQEFEKFATEIAEVERSPPRPLNRADAHRKRPGRKKKVYTVPDDPPVTGRGHKETIAKLEGRDYIPPLKVMKVEKHVKSKRQAVYEPTIPPRCLQSKRVERETPFGDISEEIDDRLEKQRRKGKGRAV